MAKPVGTFTISLDLELQWGVRDERTLPSYSTNVLGVREVVPRLLDAFGRAGVRATWATVGFLFFDEKEELLAHLPAERPAYTRRELSPYADLPSIGTNERVDPYHFGRSLLLQIRAHATQEIGSHTFSHYYCLESGQTAAQFAADLAAARAAAELIGVRPKSLVFPRNQFNRRYLQVCRAAGFEAVRGNERAWFHRPQRTREESLVKRAIRLADHYVPLSGPNVHATSFVEGLVNVPSSRFLRPATPRAQLLDRARLARIQREMTFAAKNGLLYHLWWHPHNFGADVQANLSFLAAVLEHHRRLAGEHGMVSRTMGEVSDAARAASETSVGAA